MLHCSVGHWGALSHENTISIMGWVKVQQETSPERFLDVVDDMRTGRRPLERGALVVAGAVFPLDTNLRRWLLEKFRGKENALCIAATFALAAHLDHDEELSDWFTLQRFKLPRTDPNDARRVAVQLVLSIWESSKGTGRCTECGKTPT